MKRTDPFYYGAPWRTLKRLAHDRDGWRCIVCGIDVSRPGAARADHIVPRSVRPELALALGNVRTLCAACDNQSHREKGRGGRARIARFAPMGCRPDGTPIDPAHPWNLESSD